MVDGNGRGLAQDATLQAMLVALGVGPPPMGGNGRGLAQDATLQAILAAISGGSGGGLRSAVIFRPGVASAGNAVATWPEVQAAIAAANGAITVYIDGQNAACHVPASSGTTDCQGGVVFTSFNLLAGVGGIAQQTLTIDDGAVLHRPRAFVQCDIVCACTTTTALTFDTTVAPTDTLATSFMGISLAATATVPAIAIGAGGQLNVISTLSTTLDTSLAGTVPLIQLGTGATLNWIAYGGVILAGTNTINGGGAGATIDFSHDNMSAVPNFTGMGFTGTVVEVRSSFGSQLNLGVGTPALTGALRFPSTAQALATARNAANTADLSLLALDGSNNLSVGDQTHVNTLTFLSVGGYSFFAGAAQLMSLFAGTMRAGTDNNMALGTAAIAWSTVFAYLLRGGSTAGSALAFAPTTVALTSGANNVLTAAQAGFPTLKFTCAGGLLGVGTSVTFPSVDGAPWQCDFSAINFGAFSIALIANGVTWTGAANITTSAATQFPRVRYTAGAARLVGTFDVQ